MITKVLKMSENLGKLVIKIATSLENQRFANAKTKTHREADQLHR